MPRPEGGYDFTFSFSPAVSSIERRKSEDGDSAARPGLRSQQCFLIRRRDQAARFEVEMQAPNPVLVIDHVEQKPTDSEPRTPLLVP